MNIVELNMHDLHLLQPTVEEEVPFTVFIVVYGKT